jgi:hypothetical protein
MIAQHKSSRSGAMDQIVIALAQAVGLHKALELFPEDVQAAAEQALRNAGVVQVPTDPAAEPWPPMRAGLGL